MGLCCIYTVFNSTVGRRRGLTENLCPKSDNVYHCSVSLLQQAGGEGGVSSEEVRLISASKYTHHVVMHSTIVPSRDRAFQDLCAERACIKRSWYQDAMHSKKHCTRRSCILKSLPKRLCIPRSLLEEIMHFKIVAPRDHILQDLALIDHAFQDRCTKRICIPVVASRDHSSHC